ncbi:MAG TPA: SDR family oxidoreductase [Microthrixaceae bacterium]|nr:SDR family oxidoreductase [Microthrixaceae bacterium]
MHRPLAQQNIVVFGASSGIGRATALAAAARGARVMAAGRDTEALASLAAEAARPVETIVAEAADDASVRSVADHAVDQFGGIDTWAHVAGIAEYGRFGDIPPDEFRRVIDVAPAPTA